MSSLWSSATAMGRAIGETVLQHTGIPTCTGTATTKTLAKLANFVAKKRPEFGGVFDISTLSDRDLDKLLDSIPAGEVWGIGSRLNARLSQLGVVTVNDLRRASPSWLRSHFGVVVERTAMELRGISCIEIEEIIPAKKQIVSSKTFGQMVLDLDELGESVAAYMTRAAEKLRAQNSVAEAIQVFVQTNRHRLDHDQYANCITVPLTHPSNDTRLLIRAALYGLKQIFRQGFYYKKSGVVLTGLSEARHEQSELFDNPAKLVNRARADCMMQTLDALNKRFGRDTVTVAAAGINKPWKMRTDRIAPAYTTRWSELPQAFI